MYHLSKPVKCQIYKP